MGLEIETEFKILINRIDFIDILKNNKVYDFKTQSNFYFDTSNNILCENNITLRVRKENDSNMKLTMKQKIRNESSIVTSREYSVFISSEDFALLLKTPDLLMSFLPCEAKEVIGEIINENIKENKKLTFLGAFINNRFIIKDNDYTLELDQSIFSNHHIDYELEIENITSNDIEKIINKYRLNKYTVNTKSKYKRFVEIINSSLN
ncbi:CYTH domain-containing protein [Bacillus clarus]|uniref:CYTH domain protein n=2 Tax=Bacillus clarus TaxID=2338372 RepID=A0A090YLR8_9BACI|nr:CYTH domain-containing protein [Bacillus clarus]KFM99156.1 CYTH domain protein [Bacillus clarus]